MGEVIGQLVFYHPSSLSQAQSLQPEIAIYSYTTESSFSAVLHCMPPRARAWIAVRRRSTASHAKRARDFDPILINIENYYEFTLN